MSFTPYSGRWTSRSVRTKSSTAYAANGVVYSDGTDIVPGVNTTEDILGITIAAKASASNNNPIVIRVPSQGESSTALADVGTGTASAAYEGHLCDLDTASPETKVNINGTTEGALRIIKALSSSVVVVSFVSQKR